MSTIKNIIHCHITKVYYQIFREMVLNFLGKKQTFQEKVIPNIKCKIEKPTLIKTIPLHKN